MNSNGILHATVDHNGTIRLYESPNDAMRCKTESEVVIQISLTSHQMALVLRAEQLARSKVRPQ
jgi:hypothetical protein